MRVIILRHGEAVFSGNDRVLSDNGILEAKATASKLQELKLTKCLVSPKTRAVQTATIVTDSLGFKGELEHLSDLTPSGDPSAIIDYIDATCTEHDTVLLVSHLPLVEYLAYSFVQKTAFPPSFNTACALVLDYHKGIGHYLSFVSPRALTISF